MRHVYMITAIITLVIITVACNDESTEPQTTISDVDINQSINDDSASQESMSKIDSIRITYDWVTIDWQENEEKGSEEVILYNGDETEMLSNMRVTDITFFGFGRDMILTLNERLSTVDLDEAGVGDFLNQGYSLTYSMAASLSQLDISPILIESLNEEGVQKLFVYQNFDELIFTASIKNTEESGY